MILTQESTRKLQEFLEGDLAPGAFGEWITSAEGDDQLIDFERDALGQLRLLLLEYSEDLRPLEEVRVVAASLLIESGSTDQLTSSNMTESPNLVVEVEPLPMSLDYTARQTASV